jgi:hypothetical protein
MENVMPKTLPNKFLLEHYLAYSPATGEFLWKERVPDMFLNTAHSAEHQCRRWNAANARQRATYIAANGYAYISIDGVKYLAHRIAWKMFHNTEPDNIDHVNGDRADNRIANLRSVDRDTNARNMRKSKRNTSGVTGVSWRAARNKWRAYIMVDNKQITLGHFSTIEEAAKAREEASRIYDYHPNHGN